MRLPLPRLAPLLLALALGTPAAADWLVTRDGQRLETAGPWEVRGPLVVFRLAGSDALASLRVREVDLEASEAATEAALAAARRRAAERAEPTEPAAPADRDPVLVLTDDDVAHVGPGAGGAAAEATTGGGTEEAGEEGRAGADRDTRGDAQGDAEGDAGESAPGPVTVRSWRLLPSPDGEGVEVFGTLENGGGVTARSLAVEVEARDTDGSLLTASEAEIGARSLEPGASANFRASFDGLVVPPQVTFRVTARTPGG